MKDLKNVAKFAIVFALGMMLVFGMQAYQDAQMDDELFNSRYRLRIRLVPRGDMEFSDMSTTTISAIDSDGLLVDKITLWKPSAIKAREGEANLIATRWEWAEYDLKVEGDDFETFMFKVKPYEFKENDPWQISSVVELIYDDWMSSPDFIIWVGLGY